LTRHTELRPRALPIGTITKLLENFPHLKGMQRDARGALAFLGGIGP